MSVDDKRAIRVLRMLIEAAERAMTDIEHGLPVEHSAGAIGTNAGVALQECGAYSQRERDRLNAGNPDRRGQLLRESEG